MTKAQTKKVTRQSCFPPNPTLAEAISGAVYMEAGLARLPRQPGKRDGFVMCLYEKISFRLPRQFCCFDSC